MIVVGFDVVTDYCDIKAAVLFTEMDTLLRSHLPIGIIDFRLRLSEWECVQTSTQRTMSLFVKYEKDLISPCRNKS